MNRLIDKIKILIVIFFGLYSQISFSQTSEENFVAKVGGRSITKKEFLMRYELSPGLRRVGKSNVEHLKREFLYTLIAEKLWAEESSVVGIDTLDVVQFADEEFKKMFVRDALYKKEVTDKISISDAELIEGYFRNKTKLLINFLYSENLEKINNLYSMLNQGISFDSVLSVRPENEEQVSPIEIVFGQMEQTIEDSLYKLEVGEYTRPIITPDGWYIFRLTNKVESLFNTADDIEEARKSVEKIIKDRKSIKLYKGFFTDFFKKRSVDVDPLLFEKLAQEISKRLKWKKTNHRISDNNLLNLLAEDVIVIENELKDINLQKFFVEIDGKHYSLKHLFRVLAFDGFVSENFDIASIRKLLDTKVRNFIEHELLAMEGIRRGYLSLPEVIADVNIWRENYLFQALKDKFKDSVNVSDDEIYSYYKSRNKEEKYPKLFNIVEILTDSIEIVDIVLQELNKGKSIDELAKKYNKRSWTKDNYGEYGFFPASHYGEIGRIAKTMNVGDVYGPLELPEGYSIFKLIDKRDCKTVPPVPFEKVRDEYKRILIYEKAKLKMDNYTASLAIKYGVSLNFDLLDSIEVTNISSIAIRKLGFGGKITAVPILAPNIDWVNSWLEKINTIQ